MKPPAPDRSSLKPALAGAAAPVPFLGRATAQPQKSRAVLSYQTLLDAETQWYMATSRSAPKGSIGVADAWELAGTVGRKEVVIGFIDDGFDLQHPDLAAIPIRQRCEVDFGPPPRLVRDRTNPLCTATDFHGTAQLGLALGRPRRPGGIVGVAPGCSAALVKYPVRERNNQDHLWRAIDLIAPKVDVICLSFHPYAFADGGDLPELDFLLDKRFSALSESGGRLQNGIVFVVSAGNDNCGVLQRSGVVKTREFLTGTRRTHTGGVNNVFASHPAVIAVAASNSRNQHAAYSNWGEEIFLCGPSDDYDPRRYLGSWVPIQGTETLTVPWSRRFRIANRAKKILDKLHPGEQYRTDFGGTSAATAIVAGAVALIRSVNPKLTGAEVKEILAATTDKIVDVKPDRVLGKKFGDYGPNERCYWFGHGRINVLEAVRAAMPTSAATTMHKAASLRRRKPRGPLARRKRRGHSVGK
jgi:subtilisin family serine protease